MINLHFEIDAGFYYSDDFSNYNYDVKKIIIEKVYNDNTTFGEVIDNIYDLYSHCNKSDKPVYFYNLDLLFWGQFFDEKLCENLDYSISDYYKVKLGDLERQFEISNMTIPIWLDPDGLGAVVGEKEGIKFFFHSNEKDIHNKPHIHCSYSGVETRVEIDTLKVLDKPFKKKKMDLAIKYIKKNQVGLLNYWNKVVVKGEALKFKMEI